MSYSSFPALRCVRLLCAVTHSSWLHPTPEVPRSLTPAFDQKTAKKRWMQQDGQSDFHSSETICERGMKGQREDNRLSSWGEQAWDTVCVSELRLVCLNTVFLFHRVSSETGIFAESRKGVCRYANLEGILQCFEKTFLGLMTVQ